MVARCQGRVIFCDDTPQILGLALWRTVLVVDSDHLNSLFVDVIVQQTIIKVKGAEAPLFWIRSAYVALIGIVFFFICATVP
jgi:hypothetical protein